ncbi:cation:proton antiporter [Desertifilum sp. FACHB-1129]|uniref:Cation:proton antiporter n=1 Tax=Desertifilum tharense IPPAS B-1220 TaxID=1781255 RepID=A0A1E5QP19_9CYAN|nr:MULTISPECIES: cation:proton antiporter [Desertifilum]MDA0209393.1 cation:proton antiporter [Cyanobacteria bacterium FC1]MBD2311667.1 cation:proton antiporter [Desertifilum sp. FACHB-1129]MBD2322808.1 cation:proton antiporter [Desertifilum sp. FACHB-866]MBD2332798.1 cation:proton antiporter [Desertifilum sp. FACHB-868]OEJ76354.1 cation:proton antiporter [Desertifilum tharense IPPAS B-1220]
MNTLTIAWIALPLIVGFVGYLFPRVMRYLSLGAAIASAGYAAFGFTQPPFTLELLDSFGISLQVDSLSCFFILTNALVTTAVILYCWQTSKTPFFYLQTIILHGSVNTVFICADFMSVYVALEVIGIAAFLLVAYPRSDRAIWVGLRYLFTSNIAMLFYLVGTILVYQSHHSFAFTGLRGAPPEAIALIFLGLLSKGGIFVSGLWLPLTHAESETPVSALLSGVVIKTGAFPLLRCALMVEEVAPIVTLFGIATALLGVCYALFEQDSKRVLASSSISQLGWIMVAPAAGGFYALAHGLAKAALFLTAGNLPSRNLKELEQKPINTKLWLVLVMGSLSMSGFPLFIGFSAKILTLKSLTFWPTLAMNIAAIGTAILYAKFIFLPHQPQDPKDPSPVKLGYWLATGLLIAGLFIGNGFYYEAYTLENIVKVLAIIGVGWLIHRVLIQHFAFKIPLILEEFDHIIGVMSLMLVLLFWMVLA